MIFFALDVYLITVGSGCKLIMQIIVFDEILFQVRHVNIQNHKKTYSYLFQRKQFNIEGHSNTPLMKSISRHYKMGLLKWVRYMEFTNIAYNPWIIQLIVEHCVTLQCGQVRSYGPKTNKHYQWDSRCHIPPRTQTLLWLHLPHATHINMLTHQQISEP